MRELDIPVIVLKNERPRALEHAGAAAGEARRMAAADDQLAAGLDANQPHVAILDEGIEDAHGVAAAADAGHDRCRQRAGLLEQLRARLPSDDRLKLAHHQRIRVRPEHRPQQVVRVADIRHPVAHRLVDRVLQRPAAGVHAPHVRAEQAHAEHVQRLAVHVFGTHVDEALEPEQRARGRARHAVLPRAGLGDDAALAHALREQRLTEGVVDLVRAGVRQILALEKDPPAARRLRQPRRFVERRGTADVVLQQPIQFLVKRIVDARGEIRALELFDRLDERLGNVASAELAEVAAGVRVAPRCDWRHAGPRTARAGAGDL